MNKLTSPLSASLSGLLESPPIELEMASIQATKPIRRLTTNNLPSRPSNRRDTTGPDARRRGSNRPPAPLTQLPIAPVRVVSVGEPGLDHPLRPITEPEPLTVGDPTQVAATVVRAAVEVLDGRRSLNQIRRWLTPQVALQLAERTRLELAIPNREDSTGPIRIRKVHLVRFGDRAEATVLIDMADRTRAAAARLEARQGAWRVSVLEIA